MKRFIFPASIMFLFLISCSPRHYHGCGFIESPDFDQFGASLERGKGVYIIKSYIRSEIFFRTEYIYENFDITLPDTLIPGKEYRVGEIPAVIWYAKGGQVGQIESGKAEGTLTITAVSDSEMRLQLDLTFLDMKKGGGSFTDFPPTIRRKGTLRAIRNYTLY